MGIKTKRLRISDAAIKKAHKDLSIDRLSDERFPLQLRFGRNTNRQKLLGYWYRIKYIKGKGKWAPIGKWPQLSASLIIEQMPALVMADRQNKDALINEWDSFSGCLHWYLGHVEASPTYKKQRKAEIKSIVNTYLLPLVGELPIQGIRKHHIKDSLIFYLVKNNLALGTIKSYLDVLKAAFNQAVREERLLVNPIHAMQFKDFIQKEIKPKELRLLPDMVESVFNRLQSFSQMQQVFVLVQLGHGTRIQETRLLRWRYIDWQEQILRIPASITKTGESLDLPLTEPFITLLNEYKKHCISGEFLFPNRRGQAIGKDTANRIYQSLSSGDWTSHHLRKLFRSRMGDFDVDSDVAEKLINHKLSTVKRAYVYTKHLEQKRRALQTYHDWLSPLGLFLFTHKDPTKIQKQPIALQAQ